MRPQEIIRKKRDGERLSRAEIGSFVAGVTDKTWADYQISALLMAIFLNGLDRDEGACLTGEMLNSGEVLDFSDIERPKADKHSTGGVGDKTSLIIAPLAAACGLAVPMISGRGLGHTGGTLDKLESISGYRVNLSLAEFKQTIKTCGFAMTGQTAEIAPADRRLYALRDATSTVEYIPLIVASIMSKKMAEGLDVLVLDVKTGSGAFMTDFEKSKELARAMVETGKKCGVRTEAVISDMSQPLGKYVGNALEVYECVKILRGETADLAMEETAELSVELTARMLNLTATADGDIEAARSKALENLLSGAALEKFRENIELQGGDARICDRPELLLGEKTFEVKVQAEQTGFVSAVDTRAVGDAVCALGGGRVRVEDKIDFAVGFRCEAKIGDYVRAGDTLGVVYCRSEDQAEAAVEKLRAAYEIADAEPPEIGLILENIA